MKTKAFILFLSILLLLSSCGVNSENSSSNSSPKISTASSADMTLDENGVAWSSFI